MTGYSRAQITLHWVIVGLIALQLGINDGVEAAFNGRMNHRAGAISAWAILHIAAGLTVLALAVVRLILRLTQGVPSPPADNAALVTWTGHLTHFTLYLMMFAMPATGAIAWFGFSEIAAGLHEWGWWALTLLIALHVAGALAEHFLFGQDTLMRMFRTTPPKRND